MNRFLVLALLSLAEMSRRVAVMLDVVNEREAADACRTAADSFQLHADVADVVDASPEPLAAPSPPPEPSAAPTVEDVLPSSGASNELATHPYKDVL
jgi:hypothetical protein